MEKAYEKGGWCFHLPSPLHLESFIALKETTGDAFLTGFGQIGAESGVSLTGKPLSRFESKMAATISKTIAPPPFSRKLLPEGATGDILTQREIDRMRFDPPRFHQTLVPFDRQDVPFLLIGGIWGDWLLGLGRGDLLKEMISAIRGKGKIPIYRGEWTTFVLPKAKPLDVAAHAVPMNKKMGRTIFEEACNLIKKFEKPVIGLDLFSGRNICGRSEDPFSTLLNDLKVYSVIAEVTSDEDLESIFRRAEKISSLIPPRKT